MFFFVSRYPGTATHPPEHWTPAVVSRHCCRKHDTEEERNFTTGSFSRKICLRMGCRFRVTARRGGSWSAVFLLLLFPFRFSFFFFITCIIYIFQLPVRRGGGCSGAVFCCSLIRSIVHCRGGCIQVVVRPFRSFIWPAVWDLVLGFASFFFLFIKLSVSVLRPAVVFRICFFFFQRLRLKIGWKKIEDRKIV